jgi:DNA-binding winged helix-turn-helix (wHTH) protein
MTHSRYRFNGCTLDAQRRELRVDGQAHALEPRPFNLLVYLLQNRHRVVSTDELLDRLWPGVFVTIGSVARAIAKLRKAIRCSQGKPTLIQTVHRLGYRFIGEVTEEPADTSDREAPALPDTQLGVIAVLPFENLTGNRSLDWMTLYLMSLICNAMAIEARLSPLSMHKLAESMLVDQGHPTLEDCEIAIRQRYGVEHVVQARLSGAAPNYLLEYRLLSAGRHANGRVEGTNPVTLGRQLAKLLLRHVQHDASVQEGDVGAGVDVESAWVTQLLDRAVLALEKGQRKHAKSLLDVVLDEAPNHAIARELHEHMQARVSE